MGYEDRPYYRDERGPGGFGGGGGGGFSLGSGLSGSVMVIWLLGINAGVFLLDALLGRAIGVYQMQFGRFIVQYSPIEFWGYFSIDTVFAGGQLWRILTFQFLHDGLWHLLGNMLGLFFLGPIVERWLGSRRFLAFYLLCGVSGSIMYVLLWGMGILINSSAVPLIGASAGVFGILMAAALIAPNVNVLLFFILPVPLKYVIWGALFIAAAVVIGGGNNAGGEAAHLGGAALGFLLIKYPGYLNWADGLGARLRGPSPAQREARQRQRAKQQQAAEQQEVDRILDKVRQHGMQSLTGKEKKTLQRATERSKRG